MRKIGAVADSSRHLTLKLAEVFFEMEVDGQVREPGKPLVAVLHDTAKPGCGVASHQGEPARYTIC
jgi:hypothetical protein